MERPDGHLQDDVEPPGEDEGDALSAQMGDQVRTAREQVFRAYLDARERARELGGLEDDPAGAA